MTLWIDRINQKLYDDMEGGALSLPAWPDNLEIATSEEIESINNPPKTQEEIAAENRQRAIAQFLESKKREADDLEISGNLVGAIDIRIKYGLL